MRRGHVFSGPLDKPLSVARLVGRQAEDSPAGERQPSSKPNTEDTPAETLESKSSA